jgi:preprotein translocase subunit SecA
VQGGKVVIVDEFTGRLMPGRRWSDGLHQAVEAKEGVKVQSESVTYATITLQNYFRMYEKLAGMTGTALTEAEEFDKIYKLGVLAIPTNLEYLASRPVSGLEELEERDEQGYKYRYYAHKEDPIKAPVYWKRKDYPDVVYRTEEAKLRAIVREILRYHVLGRPLLVGTTSVELSDRLSNRLRAEPIRRLCQVLLLRSFWLERNHREEDGRQIAELQSLNQPLEKMDPAELRKLARDLNISFNPEDPANLDRLFNLLELPADHTERLVADLQGGIPHQVLNARKHTEESQIIAGAGAYGAVTIATNMAGRGVDIKLGGELAEEILTGIHRVLSKAGYKDSYNMSLEEIRQALSDIPTENYGIYEAEVGYFLKDLQDMERVRQLGGLFVIGSERHEARRIDNQLRGRSARQGDPGASRFYLSLEDELMRLFGGQQADGLMQRLKIDDALPLEVGLVGRLVEQSQTRVEGANFDIRKHLLEYDDVLNTQRVKIYNQRDRIFTKQDLGEDVSEMLRVEVNRRVPEALKDEGGPWKLLSWLEQIQPSFITNYRVYPSYSLRLLAEAILQGRETIDKQAALQLLIETAQKAIRIEQEHVMQAVVTILDQTEERLESQKRERLESVDTFFEGLVLEEEAQNRRPADLLAELSSLLHIQVRLSPEGQRTLLTNPQEAAAEIRIQVENALISQAVNRLIGAVERRVEESIDFSPSQISLEDWNELSEQILQAVEKIFDGRVKRYLGDEQFGAGQIQRELEGYLARLPDEIDRNLLLNLLLSMPQGTKTVFDRKTHRRVWQRTTRLTYIYQSAHFLENRAPEEIAADVLDHLEQAQEAMYQAWGTTEWNRGSSLRLVDLNEATRQRFLDSFGQEHFSEIENLPLSELSSPDREAAISLLGRQALTEIYRQLLLSIITELWVDYLTQMEALRISIGLEAYAQRDPLVQYKNRAFGLFQELLGNMRLAVISRMFTYRPRDLSAAQTTTLPSETARGEAASLDEDAFEEDAGEAQEEEPEEDDEMEAAAAGSPSVAESNLSKPGQPAPGGKRKRRRRR